MTVWTDYDDAGELAEYRVLSERTLTAAKAHRCDGWRFLDDHRCTEPIASGTRYRRQARLEAGTFYSLKRHPRCYIRA